MKNQKKTKEELLKENEILQKKVKELESGKNKKTEEALRESKERFNSIYNHSPNPTHLINSDFEIILTNLKLLQMKGLKQEEIIGKKCYEVYQNNKEICKNCAVKQVFEKRINAQSENQLTLSNGDINYYETYAYPIYNKQNEITHAVETTIDISERKRSEKKLRESEEKLKESENRFKYLSDASMEALFFTKDGICIDANNTASEMFGYNNPSEFIGRFGTEIIAEESHEIVKEHMLNNLTDSYEAVAKRKDGTLFPVLIKAKSMSVKDNGKIRVTSILDITERKKIEQKQKESDEKLKESENRFEAFMNHIPAGIFIKDADGRYLFSNKFNSERHSVINWKGKTVFDFFPKKVAERFTVDDQKVLSGKNLIVEGSVFDKKGKEFYYKNYQFSITQSDGKKLIGGISFDVTKEKQVIEELKESEEKFRILAQTAPMAIMLYQDDKWIFANNKAEEICEYKISELKKMNFWEFVAPEYQKIVKKRGGAREKGIKTNSNYEFKIITKSAKEKWVLLNGSTIKYGDKYAGLITILDITENKQAQEKLLNNERVYKTLINNLPGFAYRCNNDKNWTMKYISKGCEDITAYSPEDFIDNKKIAFNDIILPDYRQLIWDIWQDILEKKKIFEFEYPITTKNNEVRWVWERGCGIYSDNDELLFLEGFITDITERKQAENELIDKMSKLEKWNKLTVGRELKMIELKKEVNNLLKDAGFSEKYKIINR